MFVRVCVCCSLATAGANDSERPSKLPSREAIRKLSHDQLTSVFLKQTKTMQALNKKHEEVRIRAYWCSREGSLSLEVMLINFISRAKLA